MFKVSLQQVQNFVPKRHAASFLERGGDLSMFLSVC